MDIEDIKILSFKNPVLVYDGVCVLCNGYVNWLLRRDKKEIFRYTTLQEKPDIKNSLPTEDNDTVVLYKNGKEYTHSDVALMIFKDLGGWWTILALKLYIPKIIRDTIYRWIARNRYRWFGKKDSCQLPPEGKGHLFI